MRISSFLSFFFVFHCFSLFSVVFHCFSTFFIIFHHFSTFSSFCFVFHRFSSSQIYFHSEMKRLLHTTSAEISIIYSTKLCMFNPCSLLVLWKLCLQLFLISKYWGLLQMKLACCKLILLCFEGAHFKSNVWGATFKTKCLRVHI